jgi:hypothetical protein
MVPSSGVLFQRFETRTFGGHSFRQPAGAFLSTRIATASGILRHFVCKPNLPANTPPARPFRFEALFADRETRWRRDELSITHKLCMTPVRRFQGTGTF